MDDTNWVELVERFADEDKARKYLEAIRWPHGVRCPRCSSEKISRVLKRDQFDCDSCRYQFSVTSGTVFHDSHLPLWKWLLAIYLMIGSQKGISANQVKSILKVSYKTAWYLCHRIRKAIEELKNKPKLDGTIEIDETYIGGRVDKRRKGGPSVKRSVIGLRRRPGQFEARKIPTTIRKFPARIINEHVDDHAQVLMHEYAAFKFLDKLYEHETVNHGEEEWVLGNVYANGVESAWSLFRRSVVGSFHHVSLKHFESYVDEFVWRFKNRENPFLFRDTVTRLLLAQNLEYKKLTKKAF